MPTKPLKLLSYLVIGAVLAMPGAVLANDGFKLPPSSTAVYSGTSGRTLESCDVTIKTDAAGKIVYLAMTGTFSGRALSTPSTLRPISGGYEGVVEFFKGIAPSSVVYEKHIFRPGLTLSWFDQPIPTHTREAQFFGQDLAHLGSFAYSEQGPFLRLKGECRDLNRRSPEL
jgi:hypothetical protein